MIEVYCCNEKIHAEMVKWHCVDLMYHVLTKNASGFLGKFFQEGTLEEGERGLLPVPVPKCKEP